MNRLYFLQGAPDKGISAEAIAQLSRTLLADPVTETFSVSHAIPDRPPSETAETVAAATAVHSIEVTLLPGVTDAAADNLLHAAKLLGIEGLARTATGQRYLIDEALSVRANWPNWRLNLPIR